MSAESTSLSWWRLKWWNSFRLNDISRSVFTSFVSFILYYFKFVCSDLFRPSHIPVNSQTLRENWSFVCVCSVSRPDTIVFPPPNWSPSQSLREEQDVGPEVLQVYEVLRDSAASARQKNPNLFNLTTISLPRTVVDQQWPQLGESVHLRGELSLEGPGPPAALPAGGGHPGAAQLLFQAHIQCTETQGEATPTGNVAKN